MPVRNQSEFDSSGGIEIIPPKNEKSQKEEKKNESEKHPEK